MNSRRLPCLTALLLAVSLPLQAADEPLDRTGQIKDDAYNAVLAGEWRSSENQLRDPERRPMETLRFFDLSPTQTVIEISPDDGWYSEILAPLLRDQGQYIAAVRSSDDPQQHERADALRAKLKGDPARYDKARIIELDPKSPKLGEAESADLVLSFDDLHNWEEAGSEESMFKAIYAVLKPGGKLGVTAFRAAKGDTLEAVRGSGYLPTDHVVERAKAAGFVLATMEQMHSNPRDDHDHPQGVWSLPPFFAEGEKDRKDYEAVGEPDRMTLLFVKPSAPRP